jgi:hypothetical protein
VQRDSMISTMYVVFVLSILDFVRYVDHRANVLRQLKIS